MFSTVSSVVRSCGPDDRPSIRFRLLGDFLRPISGTGHLLAAPPQHTAFSLQDLLQAAQNIGRRFESQEPVDEDPDGDQDEADDADHDGCANPPVRVGHPSRLGSSSRWAAKPVRLVHGRGSRIWGFCAEQGTEYYAGTGRENAGCEHLESSVVEVDGSRVCRGDATW